MNHLRLHDLWLYSVALLLFGIFILIIYIAFRCSDRTQPRKRRKESVLYFNMEENMPNPMPNFGEWKSGKLPSYISQWSFQDECDEDLEWKRQLSLKSRCSECEKLLQEESGQQKSLIISKGKVTSLAYATAV